MSEGSSINDGRPTVAELQGGHHFAKLANQSWLSGTSVSKNHNDFVKTDVWDVLALENFSFHSLLVLEHLQFLEKSVKGLFCTDEASANSDDLDTSGRLTQIHHQTSTSYSQLFCPV